MQFNNLRQLTLAEVRACGVHLFLNLLLCGSQGNLCCLCSCSWQWLREHSYYIASHWQEAHSPQCQPRCLQVSSFWPLIWTIFYFIPQPWQLFKKNWRGLIRVNRAFMEMILKASWSSSSSSSLFFSSKCKYLLSQSFGNINSIRTLVLSYISVDTSSVFIPLVAVTWGFWQCHFSRCLMLASNEDEFQLGE